MTFVRPLLFTEAVDKLGSKSPIGSQLKSAQWSAVAVELRERAFFSATIESVRFLQSVKDNLTDFLEGNRETITKPDGTTVTALKVGSRAQFIQNIRRAAIAEGLGPLDPEDAKTIKDIRSEKRLGLIFDVGVSAARAYGDRQQGLDPDVLNEFPAQRFIRVQEVKTDRAAHVPYEGFVALKSDIKAWLRINQDFGVPWGPWGWGCGHDVEDVSRDETDALGLTRPGEQVASAKREPFNANLKASVKNLDPEMVDFLKKNFGDKVEFVDGEARWKIQGGRDINVPSETLANVKDLPNEKALEQEAISLLVQLIQGYGDEAPRRLENVPTSIADLVGEDRARELYRQLLNHL